MICTDYFDLHCDTPFECYRRGCTLYDKSLAVNLSHEDLFSRHRQCFAIWIRDDAPNPFEIYRSILNDFKVKLSAASKSLTAHLTVEGGAVLENAVERLYRLKNDGITALTLTWNGKNRIASGSLEEGDLTDFGRTVIEVMNRLGIACDLAHLNRESFFDAIEYAEHPLVTHACCNAIQNHKRNLSDDALRLVAERGGVVGICFYPQFLGDADVFETIWRNIYHMLALGLEKNIAIGSDFDGAEMAPELSDISKIPDLYYFLLQKGLNKTVLGNIFYKNAENFFANL